MINLLDFSIFNPVPANNTCANALMKRYASALSILEDGYTFRDCTDRPDTTAYIFVMKPGETIVDASYVITAGFDYIPTGCTCPDFQKWGASFGACKHTLAYAESIRQENQACAAYDEMMANAECATGCDPYSRY